MADKHQKAKIKALLIHQMQELLSDVIVSDPRRDFYDELLEGLDKQDFSSLVSCVETLGGFDCFKRALREHLRYGIKEKFIPWFEDEVGEAVVKKEMVSWVMAEIENGVCNDSEMKVKLDLPSICGKCELHKEDVLSFNPIILHGGRVIPQYRPMSGDVAPNGCIDLGQQWMMDGLYEFRRASSLPQKLIVKKMNMSSCRLGGLTLTQKTQGTTTEVPLIDLILGNVKIKETVLQYGLSHENLIGRCKWGDYLLQGIMDIQLELHTAIGVFRGDAQDVTFGRSCFDWM